MPLLCFREQCSCQVIAGHCAVFMLCFRGQLHCCPGCGIGLCQSNPPVCPGMFWMLSIVLNVLSCALHSVVLLCIYRVQVGGLIPQFLFPHLQVSSCYPLSKYSSYSPTCSPLGALSLKGPFSAHSNTFGLNMAKARAEVTF